METALVELYAYQGAGNYIKIVILIARIIASHKANVNRFNDVLANVKG